MISHHHRLVFVHVPKCAGMAVELALGGLPVPQRTEQHFSGARYRQLYPEAWANYHRFTVVRDPVRRCLSWVRFYRRWDAVWRKHLAHVPDEVLLRDLLMSTNGLTNQTASRMLTGEEEVLKMEELDEAWPRFANAHGLPDELPRRNAAPSPTRADDVSPVTKAMIAARFPTDFSRFGYPFPDVRLEDLPLAEQGVVHWARLRRWAEVYQEGTARHDDPRGELEAWVDGLPEAEWQTRIRRLLDRMPPPLAPRGNLVLWSEVLHDAVRLELGKPSWAPWSPED